MQRIFEIADVFELPKHGVIIVGSIRHLEELNLEGIRNLIGNRIVIVSHGGVKDTYNVIGVDIPISILGEKSNINICIGHSINIKDKLKGSIVYAASKTE